MSAASTTGRLDGQSSLPAATPTVSPASAGRIKSRFLDALPSDERARIFSLADRVASDLDRWAARYPLIRRVRARPLSLSVVAAAPFDSLEALIVTSKVSLWVFTLDDLFDEEGLSSGQLVRRVRGYRQIARGAPRAREEDQLSIALADVRDTLMAFPLFTVLADEWSNALIGTIDGMVREYCWRRQFRRRGVEALPSYEAYVANGRYSIGGPPHIWSAVITTNDPTTVEHLDLLRSMEEIASRCVRLANDLRSYAKEVDEEKVNSFLLLGRSPENQGLTASARYERAEIAVRGEIERGLRDLNELYARASTGTRRPETAIARIAHFVCEFYTHYDYHTFQS